MKNTKEFIKWYLGQLHKHTEDTCIMHDNVIICTHCMLSMRVPARMFEEWDELHPAG